MAGLAQFSPFPRLPPEIRNCIWKIGTVDYPARIVDLREHLLPSEVRTDVSCDGNGIREVVGFKSRSHAPTLLYACRDSRGIAKRFYTKAFGTADMPAQIWIDFEKDTLYLSLDFCYVALEGLSWPRLRGKFQTGREEPHGYFLKELSEDIKKVKDLAVSRTRVQLFNAATHSFCQTRRTTLGDVITIAFHFANLERYTCVQFQHAPNKTADLIMADEISPVDAEGQSWRNRSGKILHPLLKEVRDLMFCDFVSYRPTDWTVEMNYWVVEEKKQNHLISGSAIRPRRSGSRQVTKKD